MKILSVTLDKCSGCAIMIKDQIVFSTSEERYTRIKSDSTFPIKSIKSALKFVNIKGSDLDKIIISTKEISISAPLTNRYSKFSVAEQIDLMHNYWDSKLNKGKKISYLESVKHKINWRFGLSPSFILILIDLIWLKGNTKVNSRFLPGNPLR